MPNKFNPFVIGLLLWLVVTTVSAGDYLTLSTVPTHSSPEESRAQMQPLADYLSKAIGRKVVVEIAKNFIEYGENLLLDKYDLVLDGPHFVGWRVQKHQHQAIVKLPGELKFVVVVADNSGIKQVKQLIAKRVCAISSPNGMTLGFIDLFANPAAVPVMVPVTTFAGGIDCIRAGDGVAAVMRNTFWNTMSDNAKKGMKLLHISQRGLPNVGFSVSKRVDADTAEKIRMALLSDNAKVSAPALFKDLKIDKFVLAQSEEYTPFGRLLRPIWGFHE